MKVLLSTIVFTTSLLLKSYYQRRYVFLQNLNKTNKKEIKSSMTVFRWLEECLIGKTFLKFFCASPMKYLGMSIFIWKSMKDPRIFMKKD